METNFSEYVPGENQLKYQLLAEFHKGGFFAIITQKMDKNGTGYEVKTHFNYEKGVKYYLKWIAQARVSGSNYKNLELQPPEFSIFSTNSSLY